jgi:3-methyladenine DNA glycosylase Tag
VSNEDEERVAQLKDQLLNQNLTDAEIARIERKIEFLENRTT